MIIKSLTLENIRSYKEAKIDLPLGTTLFEGDIGSGKSTILLSIEYGLFGLGEQKGASLLRVRCKRGGVKIVFDVDGIDYEVYRPLCRKTKRVEQDTGGYIKSGGYKKALSPSELKKEVLRVLNFNEPTDPKAKSRIFRYAIYTPQEEMKGIINDKPEQRIETLRKAFGIEDYKTAKSNAVLLTGEIKSKRDELQGRCVGKSDLENDIEYKSKDLEEGIIVLKKLNDDLNDLDNKKRRSSEELKEKNKQEREKSQDAVLLKEKNEQLSKRIENQKKINKRICEIQDDIDSEKANLDELIKIQRPTKHLKKELEDEKKALLELEKQKTGLLGTQKELERTFSKVRKELEKHGKWDKKEVEESLEKDKKELKELQKKLSKIDIFEDIKELQGEYTQLSKNIKELEEGLGDDKDITIEEMGSIILSTENNLKELEERIKKDNEEVLKLKQEKSKTEAIITESEESLAQLEQTEGLCPICESELSKTRKESLVEEKEIKIKNLQTKKSQIQERIASVSLKIKELEEQKKQILKRQKEEELQLKGLEDLSKLRLKQVKAHKDIYDIISCIGKVFGKEEQYSEDLKKALTEIKNDIKQLQDFEKEVDERVRLEDKIAEDLISYHNYKSELGKLEKTLKEVSEKLVDDQGNNKYESVEDLLNQLLEFDKQMKEKEHKQENLDKLVDNKKKLEEDVNRLSEEIEIINRSLEKAEEVRKELVTIRKECEELVKQYEEITGEWTGKKEEIAKIKEACKGIKLVIDEKTEQLNIKKRYELQTVTLTEYLNWFNQYFIPVLENIERTVMFRIQQEFNSNFKKWFGMLIDDPTKEAEINEEFTPLIRQDSEDQETDFLSGGEKTSVALAYRLSLNRIVKNISKGMNSNLLILDEPTDGFSKEQLFKMRDILQDLNCPQTIIVSHEKELRAFAQNVFEVKKRMNESVIIPQ